MRLLDLFCGAGGCSVGYHRAGFEVVGVDHAPQPRYPFALLEADAMDVLRGLLAGGTVLGWRLEEFDAIHASPPCQAYTPMAAVNRKRWNHDPTAPRLVEPCRELLQSAGRPWVIENVPGAPLQSAVTLCGSMFGLGVRRHRLFETSFLLLMDRRCRHRGQDHRGVYGDHAGDVRLWVRKDGNGAIMRAASIEDGRRRMGIDWMEWKELTQAIPPAYTEFVGRQLADAVRAAADNAVDGTGPAG